MRCETARGGGGGGTRPPPRTPRHASFWLLGSWWTCALVGVLWFRELVRQRWQEKACGVTSVNCLEGFGRDLLTWGLRGL